MAEPDLADRSVAIPAAQLATIRNRTLAERSVAFQRDYYLRGEEDMLARWLTTPDQCSVTEAIYDVLPGRMQWSLERKFADHNPFWEYCHDIVYEQNTFDITQQKMVPLSLFRLELSLHRDVLCKEIYNYITGPQDDYVGLAIFITRYGLKTYLGCIGLASWLLTRHRVLWGDYTTIRLLHDVDPETIRRSYLVMQYHKRERTRLRALYPEACIPTRTKRWMATSGWDLPGRDRDGLEDIDTQIDARGLRASKQGRHPMYTIIDDIESERHEESLAAVEETRTHFSGTAFSEQIGLSKNLLLGTFYNPASVHAEIAENAAAVKRGERNAKGTWRVIHLPAVLDEGTENERPLYPLRLGYTEIEKVVARMEADGKPMAARMQLFLDFRAKDESRFDSSGHQVVDLLTPQTEADKRISQALSDGGVPIILQADLAGKSEASAASGDYNSIWAIAYPLIDGQLNIVLLDGHSDNTSTIDESAARCLDMAQAQNAWYIFPEENPSAYVVGEAVNRVAIARGYTKYFLRYDPKGALTGTIRPLRPKGSAHAGIGNLSSWKAGHMIKFKHLWNAHRVWINKHIDPEPVRRLIAQTHSYPVLKKDDELDSASFGMDERIYSLLPAPRVQPPAAARRRYEPPSQGYVLPHTGLRVG